MKVEPYIIFEGHAEAAAAFYREAVGAEVTFLMRFGEGPEGVPPGLPASAAGKVMHMSLKIGDSTVLASDGHCSGTGAYQGFSLSITTPDAAEAARMFERLSAGGSVTMAMQKTFYSPAFGMLTDRFGVKWMVMATA